MTSTARRAVIAAAALILCGPLHVARSAEQSGARARAPANAVRYEAFGARGDGTTDDFAAIVKAHEHANQRGLPVRANDDATYYIGGKNATAVIQTDTYFGAAKFIIDDTDVEKRTAAVFQVRSALKSFKPKGITSLERNQARLPVSLPDTCVLIVTDANVKRYIRYGLNQNSGASQTDVFLVDTNGTVDEDTPIIWDFDQITRITALPLDRTTLRITGGHFTTRANAAPSKYTYYGRGISIRRSRVVVDGLEHHITGEGDHGAPYGGFINVGSCAEVTIQNTVLTGHKTYRTVGSAGRPVSMGTYDIGVNRALNVSFVNCKQTNDIKDRTYWGIMGSNYCKNLVFDGCTFSRFDAHMGVANATIRNSTLGYVGINAIGCGTFLVENSTVYGNSFISLRSDYGSTWEGEFIIRNCVFVPSCGRRVRASLIQGSYNGKHDFGYTCYMPERIIIDTLHIDDSNHPGNYRGPAIFTNFNREYTDASYEEKYPYIKTKEVLLWNVTTASGTSLRLSDNAVMFRDVKVTNARVKEPVAAKEPAAAKKPVRLAAPVARVPTSDAVLMWDTRLRILVAGALAAGATPAFRASSLRQKVKVLAINDEGALRAQAGPVAMDIAWKRLTFEERARLSAAVLTPGSAQDHLMTAFYCRAAGDEDGAREHASRAGEFAAMLDEFFETRK